MNPTQTENIAFAWEIMKLFGTGGAIALIFIAIIIKLSKLTE